jgi:hypothetical protein
MRNAIILTVCLILTTVGFSCTKHRVEVAPVEIKPIHITIDVNVKIDKALDDFFSDIDQEDPVIDTKSSDTESGK